MTGSPRDTPNPGSPAAQARGCTCPVMSNGHGRGAYGDGERYGWWYSAGCPLHRPATGQEEAEACG